jgi:hypothetical protein
MPSISPKSEGRDAFHLLHLVQQNVIQLVDLQICPLSRSNIIHFLFHQPGQQEFGPRKRKEDQGPSRLQHSSGRFEDFDQLRILFGAKNGIDQALVKAGMHHAITKGDRLAQKFMCPSVIK